MNTLVIRQQKIQTKTLITLLAIVTSVALPQVFHAIGGPATGATFLPMHIPVLLAGLLGGPIVGIAAGLASPAVSFAVSGMPAVTLLPFMMIELAGYGLAAGLLADKKMPVIGKVLVAQIAGRLLRSAAVLLAVYAFGVQTIAVASIWTTVTAGVWGIVLQLIAVPILARGLHGAFSNAE